MFYLSTVGNSRLSATTIVLSSAASTTSEAEEKITETSPMEKIITHIHENFSWTITVNELANVSPSHLSPTFKKQTGYAPVEYILKMRMERAMMLLAHSSKTVAEIAEEVGYDSVTAFIKIFKRKTNYAPSVYRKMQTSH